MYSFLLEIILMLSLGVVIYIFARAIPRVSDEIVETRHNIFDKLIASLPLEKIDTSFGIFLEKTLRKARLMILRMDNTLGSYLDNVKKMKGNGNQKNGQERPTLFSNNNGNGKGVGSNHHFSSKDDTTIGD